MPLPITEVKLKHQEVKMCLFRCILRVGKNRDETNTHIDLKENGTADAIL